jgi:hypothetical protein
MVRVKRPDAQYTAQDRVCSSYISGSFGTPEAAAAAYDAKVVATYGAFARSVAMETFPTTNTVVR